MVVVILFIFFVKIMDFKTSSIKKIKEKTLKFQLIMDAIHLLLHVKVVDKYCWGSSPFICNYGFNSIKYIEDFVSIMTQSYSENLYCLSS